MLILEDHHLHATINVNMFAFAEKLILSKINSFGIHCQKLFIRTLEK